MLDLPGLRVEVASPQVVLLAGALGLTSASEVLDLVEGLCGARLLTPQVQFFVEAVLDDRR